MIYNPYQVKTDTILKLPLFLGSYPNKVRSAWTEVWTDTWPSTVSIMAPGGSRSGLIFRDFLGSGRGW